MHITIVLAQMFCFTTVSLQERQIYLLDVFDVKMRIPRPSSSYNYTIFQKSYCFFEYTFLVNSEEIAALAWKYDMTFLRYLMSYRRKLRVAHEGCTQIELP